MRDTERFNIFIVNFDNLSILNITVSAPLKKEMKLQDVLFNLLLEHPSTQRSILSPHMWGILTKRIKTRLNISEITHQTEADAPFNYINSD